MLLSKSETTHIDVTEILHLPAYQNANQPKLQFVELSFGIRRGALGKYNYLCPRNERSLVAFA